VVRLSLKKLLETLVGFGFKQPDARIYVFLAKKGPHTAEDLEASLEIPKWQVYKSLRNLRKKGTVTAFLHRPALFSAIPFEKVIDLAAKAKTKEAQQEQASAEQAILYWENMMEEDSDSAHELRAGVEEVKK
jgi:sugar-specific transcriptional regulator TrmB